MKYEKELDQTTTFLDSLITEIKTDEGISRPSKSWLTGMLKGRLTRIEALLNERSK